MKDQQADQPSLHENNRSSSEDLQSRGEGSPRQTTSYLKQWFEEVGFTIDPKRGQNFLVDLNLIDLAIRSVNLRPDDVVLEVGTGTAALTCRLSPLAGRVITVEIDRRLAQLAREQLVDCKNVTLLECDALESKHILAKSLTDAVSESLAQSPSGRFMLVANLPFCVATPVLSNLLELDRTFDCAVVTVQRELAERMTSGPACHAYNALSVWVGSQCRSEIVRILPPNVFWPRPKVESAIVRLDVDDRLRSTIENRKRFHEFIRTVFCHRRKHLKGVLVAMAGGKKDDRAKRVVSEVFARLSFPDTMRAEEIEPQQFVVLERLYSDLLGAGVEHQS